MNQKSVFLCAWPWPDAQVIERYYGYIKNTEFKKLWEAKTCKHNWFPYFWVSASKVQWTSSVQQYFPYQYFVHSSKELDSNSLTAGRLTTRSLNLLTLLFNTYISSHVSILSRVINWITRCTYYQKMLRIFDYIKLLT